MNIYGKLYQSHFKYSIVYIMVYITLYNVYITYIL
jgi:hypothetical protein